MIPPGCEARCPGCAHRELSKEESESAKFHWLCRALAPWKSALEPLRAVAEERRWNYRDKTVVHAVRADTRWEFGLRLPARGKDGRGKHKEVEIVPIPRCPVHSERARRALAIFADGLPPGIELRFVALAGALATLVLKAPPGAPGTNELGEAVEKLSVALRAAGIEGVFVNFNPAAGRRVFSSRGWRHLWGEPTAVAGAPAASSGPRHGPQGFQQLIPELFEDALSESRHWLDPSPGSFVLDLYSGLGVSIRIWQAMGAESIGVELLGEAAGFMPGSILQGRVSERIPQLEARVAPFRGKVTVFANPPRTGLEPEVVNWLGAGVRPSRIAYLSCSAGTLARDLSKLDNCGYRVKRILPYDFFPQTAHVEALALLDLDSPVGVPDPDPGERLRRAE